MTAGRTTTAELAPTTTARLRRGLRYKANWLQLLRFGLVGASGYVVNLAVFAAAVHVAGVGHRVGAVLAFLVAVTNNFTWNRRWTFAIGHGNVHAQALRFLVVSTCGLGLNVALLELLITVFGIAEVPAQAVAVAVVMPVNFLGNRLWTFSAPA